LEKVNWVLIRTEYETDNISQRKLAEKYNVSYPTLRDRAKREEWVKSKEKTRDKIITKTLQKTVTKIATKEADRNARFLSMSDLAADAIEEFLKQKHYKKHVVKYKYYDYEGKPDREELEAVELDVADTKALSNIVSSLGKIQKGQRLALGLDKKDDDKDKGGQIIVVHNIPRPPKE
jgi:ribosomal protein S18